MKPTPELIAKWVAKADQIAVARTIKEGAQYTPFYAEALAELAASWGAEQAQQTTEPELPEPFGYFCEWRSNDCMYPNVQEMYYGCPGNGIDNDWNNFPDIHDNLPVYTAAQMHDYAAAKVREAMAQSRDAKLLIGFISPKLVGLIRDPDADEDPDGDEGEYVPMRKTAAGNFTLALYAAMQGGKK